MISLVEYELSGLRSSMVILQVHHSSNRTANGESSRFAFSPRAPSSLLWPSSCDLLLHPVQITLKSLQGTQRCSQFHPAGPYYILGEVTPTNISAALHRHSPGWLAVPHICTGGLRVYPLFEKCR